MNHKTKDTIEGLKDISESMQINYNLIMGKKFPRKVYGEYPEKHNKDLEALSHAIQIAQAQEQAEGMFPESKDIYSYLDCKKTAILKARGFNRAISIATPILAKKILECEEKDKRIEELEKEKIPDPIYITHHQERIKHLEDCQCLICSADSSLQELQSLKSKLTKKNFLQVIDITAKERGKILKKGEKPKNRIGIDIAQALIKEFGVKK